MKLNYEFGFLEKDCPLVSRELANPWRLAVLAVGIGILIAGAQLTPSALMAERADMSLMTLRAIERGSPKVAMGNYMSVLFCLNMHTDIEKVAADDVLGRELQDLQLPKRGHP